MRVQSISVRAKGKEVTGINCIPFTQPLQSHRHSHQPTPTHSHCNHTLSRYSKSLCSRQKGSPDTTEHLINTGSRAHGSLNIKGLDVLPVLLEEGDEEVDAQHGVGNDFVVGHFDVADGDTQAEDLLELEFDGGLGFFDLGSQVVGVGDGGGELTGLVQTRTQETGDLLDDDVGGEEEIVAGSQFLDFLLALVQLFQVVSGTEVDTELFGLIAVDFVTQDADLQGGTGGVGETDGTGETLVVLDVVVLQTDLEFNGFGEVALALGSISDSQ